MWEEEDQCEEPAPPLIVKVASDLEVKLMTADNDFNCEKKTLFATYIWPGSIILAEELFMKRKLIENATVIEFGAAAGLPSIVAAKIGARRVCASDYPSKMVIETLQSNINTNNVMDRVFAQDHVWGDSVDSLLEANDMEQYDIVLAAECLWKHETHESFLRSISSVLKPGGLLLLSYSPHVPGLEDCDDRFLQLCGDFQLSIVDSKIVTAKHMWSDRETDMYVYTMVKTK